jgi:hypothetical protein
MAIEVLIPSIIKIGGGSFTEASSILKRLEVKHPLIITEPIWFARGSQNLFVCNSSGPVFPVESFRKQYRIRPRMQ